MGVDKKNLNIGAQLQTFLYALTPKLFWKKYTALYRFRYHKLRHSKSGIPP